MTEENSSSLAMLDRATEDALYAHFTVFFRRAEEERRWNLWNDVPWDQVSPAASETLTEAVEAVYAEELFLPDYSAKLLHLLRSSRGRAWFLTRWSYEESKHGLALGEWLIRAGKREDADLKAFADRLLGAEERHLWFSDPLSAIVQAVVLEDREIERYKALQAAAEAEGDGALLWILRQILSDEEEHRGFFRETLRIIKTRAPESVAAAIRQVETAPEARPFLPALRADLDLPAAS